MSLIQIKKGDDSQICPYFKTSEFYSKSKNAPASHPFHSELVEAALLLRKHFGFPWRITSTFRTTEQEHLICVANHLPLGLATTSKHVLGEAFDSQPGGTDAQNRAAMLELQNDFTSQGPIFQALRELKITGFGLYDTFIHLDVRTSPCIHRDRFGLFACWDERHNNPKKVIGAQVWNPTQHSTPVPQKKPVASPLSPSRS